MPITSDDTAILTFLTTLPARVGGAVDRGLARGRGEMINTRLGV
jgi:hypothetical protein